MGEKVNPEQPSEVSFESHTPGEVSAERNRELRQAIQIAVMYDMGYLKEGMGDDEKNDAFIKWMESGHATLFAEFFEEPAVQHMLDRDVNLVAEAIESKIKKTLH